MYLDGILTEVKVSEGKGKGTVVQLVGEGRKQARNIVIDLYRTEMSDEEALRQVEEAVGRYSDVESVLLITHEREFIERRRDG